MYVQYIQYTDSGFYYFLKEKSALPLLHVSSQRKYPSMQFKSLIKSTGLDWICVFLGIRNNHRSGETGTHVCSLYRTVQPRLDIL